MSDFPQQIKNLWRNNTLLVVLSKPSDKLKQPTHLLHAAAPASLKAQEQVVQLVRVK